MILQNKYLVWLACFILVSTHVFGQKSTKESDNFYSYKNEVGVNTTALLGNLLSLTNNTNAPYGFYYARHKKKSILRVGFNIFTNSDQVFDPLGAKTLLEQNHSIRLSYDRNLYINDRFMFHAGFDVLGRYVSSYSTTSNFFSNSVERISGGGGPALRIVFKLHDRIYLMTESTLYGEFGNQNQTTILNQDKTVGNTSFYSFKLTPPTSLYVSIHF